MEVKCVIAIDAVIAISSPIIFIDGGAPKLNAARIKNHIISAGKIINNPLFKNRLRVAVKSYKVPAILNKPEEQSP